MHKFDINYIQEMSDRYRITIHVKLTQTKPLRHMEPTDFLVSKDDQKLCVVGYLREYFERTNQIRCGHSQLLINSVKPFKPLSQDTISQWIKQVLKAAGKDISKYSAHISRAACTSYCKDIDLSISETMKSAGWSNTSPFARFYDKLVENATSETD